jgi:hypothetical protein
MDISVLSAIGFNQHDQSILASCAFFSIIGSFAHAFAADTDLKNIPKLEYTSKSDKNNDVIQTKFSYRQRMSWIIARIAIGFVVGLSVGLFYFGAMDISKVSVAHLLLMSIIMGYITPQIIEFVEKKSDQIVEKELSK